MRNLKAVARYLLALALIFAGTGHLSFARAEFQAQVPPWVPLEPDFVVLASGLVEIILGLGLLINSKYQRTFGVLTALFFIAIFPGNISQYLSGTDAFGLNTDEARAIRLLFQPILVLWALWASNFFVKKPKL